ncbi:hypothetical protein Tco_0172542 [Tanacetum coccineum]
MESLNSNSQEREMLQLQQMQDKAKKSCMISYRLLHSHLKALLNNDLKGTSIEGGFERAFATIFEQDGKVDSSKALDAGLVVTECNEKKSESVAKLLTENEKLHKENEHLKQTYKDLCDSIKKTRVQTKDHNDSLIAKINSKTIENANLKAQIQEKFASQVDENNVLSKLVTPHYLLKVRESVFVKPHHVIASGSSRNSSKESYRDELVIGYCFNQGSMNTLNPSINCSLVQEAAASRAKVLADSLVSTSIEQDAPSSSIPSSKEHEHSPIITQGF